MLGHKISGKKLKDFKAGVHTLRAMPLALRGRVGWDSALGKNHKYHHKQYSTPQCNDPSDDDTSNTMQYVPRTICLACPKCKAVELSSNKAFQLNDLDKAIKCVSCNTNQKISKWTCSCHTPWHLCQSHKLSYYERQKPLQTKPSKGSKRIHTMPHEQLVAHDRKRARCEPRAILPPQSNILSSGLRERFAYLLK